MNIGTKINEFDNSEGTVKDFNRIFPHTKLDGRMSYGDVEIGEAMIGLETVRMVYVTTREGVVKEYKHDFYPATANYVHRTSTGHTEASKKIMSRKRLAQKRYTYTATNGEETFTCHNTKVIADKLKKSVSTISQYINGNWKNKDGWIITKELTK